MADKLTRYASVVVVAGSLIGALIVVNAGDTTTPRSDQGAQQVLFNRFDPASDPAKIAAALVQLTAEIARLEADTGNRLRDLEIRGLKLDRSDHTSAPAPDEPLSTPHQPAGEPQVATQESGEAKTSADALAVIDRADIDKMQRALENRLSGEPYDARWAPEAQDSLTTALQQPTFTGSQLIDIDCRTTLCRLGVDHDSVDAEREFLHRFIGAAGLDDAEAFYRREEGPDGNVRMTFYLSRDGRRLHSLALGH
ncbi:MAG: hypothetical protein FD165_460 [Gammaproteobacteria bacterium]|nr:MAG: hypothetical protein FD165_460 [Gammaproteobacteria bacterium]TND02278.1 MAG: hypothetical protein FD120_2442 [Gammaproteobacteria bacterium]